MASRAHGLPSVCGTTIARVFSETAASSSVGSTLYVPSSQSTNTGTRWFCTIGASVAGTVSAGVITSSPGCSGRSRCGDIIDIIAARLATEAELTTTKSRAPKYSRILRSKRSP